MKELSMVPDDVKQYVIRHLDAASIFPEKWTSAAFYGTDEARHSALSNFRSELGVDVDDLESYKTQLRLLARLVKLFTEDWDAIEGTER